MLYRLLMLGVMAVGILAAQDPPSRVARLNYINGSVSFQPAGIDDWVQAAINRPLTVGDQLWSDSGSRAELHMGGAVVRLGSGTAFQFLNLDDTAVQMKLSSGAMTLRLRRLDQNESVEVDTPNMAVSLLRAGEYRIDTNPDTNETTVTVRSGEGEITTNGQAFPVRAGEQGYVGGGDGTNYSVSAAPAPGEFDQWSNSRDAREARAEYTRHVSPYVIGAEDLDDHGSWRSVPDYGDVWVPRVPAGWAPYQAGHWAWVDPWGWTWVDDQPWGFAPFHYGRWAYVGDYWGWVPGPIVERPVYAPALVAWVGGGQGRARFSLSVGGNAGVGWFALGPRDVYVPSYRVSPAYVTRINTTNTTINNVTVNNVYNNYTVNHNTITNVTYLNQSVPGAMTAVPQSALVSARPVQQVAMKVTPSQVAGLRAGAPAPQVAPQQASVLGSPANAAANAPRPPQATISRSVVAKMAPPSPPPSFAQRQTILEKQPGQPLSVQQLRQAPPQAAASAPAVKVAGPVTRIAPPVSPTPRAQITGRPGNSQPSQAPAAQNSEVQPVRPNQPPVAQPNQPVVARPPRPNQPAAIQQPQPNPPPAAMQSGPGRPEPNPAQPPNALPQRPNRPPPAQTQRSVEPQSQPPVQPPSAQERRADLPPQRPTQPPPAAPQGRAEQPPSRPVQPPPAQERRAESQPPRPYQPPPAQQKRKAEPDRKADRPKDEEKGREQR